MTAAATTAIAMVDRCIAVTRQGRPLRGVSPASSTRPTMADEKRARIDDTWDPPVIMHERKCCQDDVKCCSVKRDVYLPGSVHKTVLSILRFTTHPPVMS